MNSERQVKNDIPAMVPAASGRRLSNQIGRAFRGTFGAKTGLRMIMRSVATEMLAAGATRESVEHALESCVLHHPARVGCDSPSLVSGASPSTILVALACKCVADIAPPDREGTMRVTKDRIVLVVEPDQAARAELRTLLEGDGYTVVATGAADDAVALMDNTRIALVVTEMYLTSGAGECLLPRIARSAWRRRARVLVYTRHGHATDREWAVRNGASGYVLKRSGPARVLSVVRQLAPARDDEPD